MSAITVAKKDFADAARSRKLMGLTAVFALFTLGGAFLASWAGDLFAELEGEGAESTLDLVFALQTPAGYLVPIIALVIGYAAIAGERESGSLKFLLGLPHTRRDVVIGKILGRSAVVAVSILVGFLVGLIGLFVFVGSVSIVDYLLFTVVTILFGFVYVCIAVGLSSMTGSTTRAAAGAFGLIVFFWFIWSFLAMGLLYLVEGSLWMDDHPDWYVSLLSLSPDAAYGSAIAAVFGEGQFTIATAYGVENPPLLAEPWFGFVVLAVWALVPLGIGLWQFGRADL
ncbi:ABC transporter permease [Natronorubrum texcoconense]|uniref:ABC-2 type transport system permease protein n=1 Tax=Natronorubrum texcoconense TaxID=1095776 RepID=A0A1G9GAX4_9EURY|nr:ABC transporter permease [Natronorubrum texcoconense]SDK97796.1 ABC-2 type transport system permease protein [Natronorubrum texcoconense]